MLAVQTGLPRWHVCTANISLLGSCQNLSMISYILEFKLGKSVEATQLRARSRTVQRMHALDSLSKSLLGIKLSHTEKPVYSTVARVVDLVVRKSTATCMFAKTDSEYEPSVFA